MNTAQTISLAYGWGMHSGGWWIIGAIVMMLFMGGMMWMMMQGMGRGWSKRWSAPGQRPPTTESALEVLERRLAEGEISVEDYRARRQALTGGARRPQRAADDGEQEVPAEVTRKEDGL
jgi:putative membrane protein